MSKLLEQITESLPSNWSEISLSQYLELQECEADPDLEGTELLIEQLSILLDTDNTDPLWDELSIEEFFALTAQVSWLSRPPRAVLEREYNGYTLKPFNSLLLGEFIDIEHFISQGYTASSTIAAILYKQTRTNDWGHRVWEPYTYDLETRAQRFEGLSVSAIWAMFEEYRFWKEDFMEKYDPLFADTSEEPEGYVAEALSALERAEAQKKAAREEAQRQWSWESILWTLSGGDVSRFEDLFNSNVILIFNVLAMKKVLEV